MARPHNHPCAVRPLADTWLPQGGDFVPCRAVAARALIAH